MLELNYIIIYDINIWKVRLRVNLYAELRLWLVGSMMDKSELKDGHSWGLY